MKAFLSGVMLVAVCAVATAQAHEGPAHGDGPGREGARGPGPRQEGPRRFSGDYRHFGPDDRARWAGGGWRHEYHDGRWGWWWLADGMWYWYDTPLYPYPEVVSPVIYVPPPQPVVYADPVPAPAPAPDVPAAPPPRFRYYCPDRGYYPDVQTCRTDFVRQPIP